MKSLGALFWAAAWCAVVGSADGRDSFVLPAGAGDQTGAAWENAAGAGKLQALLDQAQPGDRIFLGSGEYRDVKVILRRSGAPEKPITISGEDRGSGLPVLVSDWSMTRPDQGPTAIGIAPGISHVAARDLVIRGYQHGIRANFRPGEVPRAGWNFENVDMDHIRHGFYLSGFAGLRISKCDLRRYSKHGFRWDAACVDVRVESCTADCSEGDEKWEEGTESLPVGFDVNDGGQPNRNLIFEGCIARNNMMPLQKNRYKNGDGFVVEGNSENVAFHQCRSFRNQDGGFDLKVKDVKLEGCVAIGNKRNFRIWTTGRLSNCFSGWGNEGIWTKGGPIVVEQTTFAGNATRAISLEDHASIGFELRKCLITTDGPVKSLATGIPGVKDTDCVQDEDLKGAGLVMPPSGGGTDDQGLIATKYPGRGYQGAAQ